MVVAFKLWAGSGSVVGLVEYDTDNANVVADLRKGRSRNPTINGLIQRLSDRAAELGVPVAVRWQRRSHPEQQDADRLSRGLPPQLAASPSTAARPISRCPVARASLLAASLRW